MRPKIHGFFLPISEFHTEMQGLTPEEQAAWMRLLVRLNQGGRIPANRLQIEAGCSEHAWSIAQAVFESRLEQDENGCFYRPDIERRVAQSLEKSEKSREKARKAANYRWSKSPRTTPTPTSHTHAPSMLQASSEHAPGMPSFKALTTNNASPSTSFQGKGAAERVAAPASTAPAGEFEPAPTPPGSASPPPGPRLVLVGESTAKPQKIARKRPSVASEAADEGIPFDDSSVGRATLLPAAQQAALRAGSRGVAKGYRDPRFEGFKDLLREFHRGVTGDPQMGGAWGMEAGKALRQFLSDQPLITLDGLSERLSHYAQAIGISRTQPRRKGSVNPHDSIPSVIRRLHLYTSGPVNTFGEPLAVGR